MTGVGPRALSLLIPLGLITALIFLDRATDPAPGRLAFIGRDGNVYIYDAARATTAQLTFDATVRSEGTGYSYHRLAWSRAGQLAFAGVARTPDSTAGTLFVTDFAGPRLKVGHSDSHFVIYTYWSPGSCSPAGCRQLAYLIEEEPAISLRLVSLHPEPANNRLGRGWPFYFSWTSDGAAMLWHIGGGRLDNSEARFQRFDLRAVSVKTLAEEPGLMLAPAFAPAGNSWLAVNAANELIMYQANRTELIASSQAGEIAYVWSPDGRQIAYASRPSVEATYFGPIFVHDVATGRQRRLTPVGLKPEAFFWSPDGQMIAYLHGTRVRNDAWLQWRVVALNTGAEYGYQPFIPTPQMRFVVASFGQYAQSHRYWSPDSRYLVYSERGRALDDTIWLIDTQAEARDPIQLAAGSLAVWSWK